MTAPLKRAQAHLAEFPLILPPDDASDAVQRALTTDPGLFGALGALTPEELRHVLDPLPPRTEEGLLLGLYDRVASDMRILGTARLESALLAARRASHEPVIALKLGRLAARLELGASWLQAAGISRDAVKRLAARTPTESDVMDIRSLYAMHRPTFAEVRIRLATQPKLTPSALPTLREAILAAQGLSAAPIASFVRQATGGHPWGTNTPLPPHRLGSRSAARILIESLRALGINTSSNGAGLVLLAGLYDMLGRTDDTTGSRQTRPPTKRGERAVIVRDVTTTVRLP